MTESPCKPLTPEVRAAVTLKDLLPTRVLNKNNTTSLEKLQVRSITEDLKDSEHVQWHFTRLSHLPLCVQKVEGSWRIALDDDKLGQLVALIAAADPDVLSVLEKPTQAPECGF